MNYEEAIVAVCVGGIVVSLLMLIVPILIYWDEKETTVPHINLKITVERCREIIGEAAAQYWVADYGGEWKQSLCVLTLLMPAGCGEHDIKPLRVRVGPETIARALKRMIEGKAVHADLGATAAITAGRVLAGGGDPDAYDRVLQVAVFDGIVYG